MIGAGETEGIAPESYRDFFENAQDMLLITDAEGLVVDANRALLEGLGYSKDELMDFPSWELIHSRAGARENKKAWRTLKRRGQVDSFGTMWCRQDGKAINVCVDAKARYDDKGDFVGAYVIANDVTEQRRLEADLRESDGRYRRIVETTNEGIWMIDAEDTTTFVNARMAEMLGYSVDEMLERSLFSFMDEENKAILGNSLERRRKGVREQYELMFIRKDGSPLWGLIEASPLVEREGRYIGAFAMITDITARKQAEDGLRESEQRFRQVADNVRDVIWMMTPDTRKMLYISPAYEEVWGRSCESLYKSPMEWAEAVHEDDRERVQVAAQDLGGFDEEFRIVRPNGEIRWIRDRGFPVRDENGEIYRTAGIATDITEKKRAEQELQDARDNLEGKVEERTRELSKTVTRLKQEIEERRKAEHEISEQAQTLQALFEESFDGILVADAESRAIKYANPASCRMFGYRQEEMQKLSVSDLHPREDLQRVFAEFEAQVQCEKTLAESIPCLKKNGSVFYVDSSSTIAIIQARRCLVGFLRDVTEHRQLDQDL